MTLTSGNVNDENCLGYAARDFFSPYKFSRRVVGSSDVSLKITHYGVCYADVIWTRNVSKHSKYLLVPGHEIVGISGEDILSMIGQTFRFLGGENEGSCDSNNNDSNSKTKERQRLEKQPS
ncbi:hypothetical protein POM88_000901 [Heracleum sosnowskyi]|uniref:Uncharacterized protein n=1 Tax=Heracleum sosnowskyi TaxID=360622 RepID=A0AAD8NA75_9APIA|nr:hypothetical protein POM88_000901 [Heracleum sosnowskyi]